VRILLLAQHYAPEEVSGAVLTTQFATDLAARGHQVWFVTAAPSYPEGVVFPGYRNRLLQHECLDGVHVVRVWSYIHPSKSFWRRFLNFATFSKVALWGGLTAGRPDLIFSFSPPLPLGIAAWALSRWWDIPWIIRVEDLFPDSAVAAGIIKNRTAIGFLFWLERWLYARTTHISVISEGFRKQLIKKGVSAEKISVMTVWADPEEIQPLPKDNDFRRQYELGDSFVVLYSGNMGLTSALEDVIQAAAGLQSFPRIRFFLIGEGVKKAALLDLAERLGAKNISFLPYQPRQTYLQALAAADLTLVTLNANSADYSFPSKIFSSMSAARPVLTVAPLENELSQIIVRSGCGRVSPPGDPIHLANMIKELMCAGSELIDMGQRGRETLETYYSRRNFVDHFDAQFIKLVG
jgi:colanic acid biosynthesis glycosyl transferase WcaI